MKRTALYALVLACVLPVYAQKPAPPSPDTNKPKMTEHQSDRLDLCVAKISEISTRYQAQMAAESNPWLSEANALIEEVQKANPDWMWHTAQGPQDHTGFIRKPVPQAPIDPHTGQPMKPVGSSAAPVPTPAPAPAVPAVPAATPKK